MEGNFNILNSLDGVYSAIESNEVPQCNENNQQVNTQLLNNVLVEWGMESELDKFISFGIGFETLQYLIPSDLEKMYPHNLGLLAKARYKLLKWQKENISEVPNLLIDDWLSRNAGLASFSRASSGCGCSGTSSPTPSTSNAGNSFSGFKLDEYIASPDGYAVFKIWSESKCLNNFAREKLVDDIVKAYTSHNVFMKDKDYLQIYDVIVNKFPSERKDFYFQLIGDTRQGRLYHKYKNTASNLRKAGLFPLEKARKKPRKGSLNTQNIPQIIDKAYLSNKEWLKFYEKPWETVEVEWRETSKARLESFKLPELSFNEILQEWPAYTKQNGDRLIDIDFETNFNNSNRLLVVWQSFVDKFVVYMEKNLKEPHREELTLLEKVSNKNNRISQFIIVRTIGLNHKRKIDIHTLI